MSVGDKGDKARAWLKEGWLVTTLLEASQAFGGHWAAHGVVIHFGKLGSDDMRTVRVDVDELPVLADYAESIGHPNAGYLAWQAQALT